MHQIDQPTWATMTNDRAVWPIPSGEPYPAPANATYAEISLALGVRDIKQFDKQLEVFIDQVEFAPIRR